MTKTPDQQTEELAAKLNAKYQPGDSFASAYFGWVGTPWRPGDTDVAFKRCWAEGFVLYIETSKPYQGMETTSLLSIHRPHGVLSVEGGLRVELAEKVVLDGAVGLPRSGPAFEAS